MKHCNQATLELLIEPNRIDMLHLIPHNIRVSVIGFFAFCAPLTLLGQEYSMTVEAAPAVDTSLTTYRFYVNMVNPTDRMSAVFGNNETPLEINAPAGAFNSPFNASWNASGINPAFLATVPDLASDTYATIGLDGPASTSGMDGASDPSVAEDENQLITPFFLTPDATSLLSNTVTGASYFILNTASNGLPDDDMRVLILQVTTAGGISGTMNVQVFPEGIGANQQLVVWEFDGAGVYGGDDLAGCTVDVACNYNPEATVDDGSCDFESCLSFGCTDEGACNFDIDAQFDDGSCTYANFPLDCQGACVNDADADGICDEFELPGCTDSNACNFNPDATDDAGNCVTPDEPYLDCDGACLNDSDGDGLCDELEQAGCTDTGACNFDGTATDDDGSCEYTSCAGSGCTDSQACNYEENAAEDDGSCDFCSCQRPATPYTLVVEGEAAVVAGMTTYRFYVTLPNQGDRMSAVFGNDEAPLILSAPAGVYNSSLNASWNPSGINPAFLGAFPELASDTYGTIGLEGPASTSGLASAADASIVEDESQPILPFFLDNEATDLLSNTVTGASWYILNTASNGLADENGRVLVLQVTTPGTVSGQMNYQVFPLGVGADQEQVSVTFEGEGVFGGDAPQINCGCTDDGAVNFDPDADYDDGSCEFEQGGCTDVNACNYDATADVDDESCVFCDCGNPDIPAYTLTVESTAATQGNLTRYRLYVDMEEGSDKLSAVFGDNQSSLRVQTPAGIFNSEFNASWNASGVASAFMSQYPELADDSYATIGLTGPASEFGPGAVNPDLLEWDQSPTTIASYFTSGGVDLDISSEVGGIWYVAGPASNAVANVDGRVLVMQVTTSGPLYGTVSAQIFPEGDGDAQFVLSWTFAGEGTFEADGFGNACGCTDMAAGNFDPVAVYDDGTCVFGIVGCTDSEACNYDPAANINDDSCVFAESGYDCEGVCLEDIDGDGVCDDFEIPGCTNPDALNYDANATDDDGSCEVLGCTYDEAQNFNPSATDDDGSCEFELLADACMGDFDGSGVIQLTDLLDLLLVYGTSCD